MKIQELFEKLEKSPAYKEFRKSEEGKDAFFCIGFFILRLKNLENEFSLDFRNESNIFTFKLPEKANEVIMQKEQIMPSQKPLEKIEESQVGKIKEDILNLKGRVELELQNNKIKNPLEEMICVLQSVNGNILWHITAMCEGFTIITIQLDAIKNSVLKFEKKNLMDFVSIKKQ